MNIGIGSMRKNIFLNVCIVVVIAIQIITYSYHILSQLKIKNEFFYIDEQTILDDSSIVSNLAFTNEKLLFDKYAWNAPYSSLDIFIDKRKSFDINNIPDFFILPYVEYGDVKNENNKFFQFYKDYERLMPIPIDSKIYQHYLHVDELIYSTLAIKLESTVGAELRYYTLNKTIDNFNYFNLQENIFSPQNAFTPFKFYPLFSAHSRNDLQTKVEFINKNFEEKILQTFDRYYFHESSFVLCPLNEYLLDKPNKEIFSQYGFLAILVIDKMMNFLGGFSIVNYDKSMKILHLVYYLFFVYFIFRFFKNQYERLVMLLILGISLFFNSYYFFQYPPGHVPVRHMFDILILYCLWKAERNKLLLLKFFTLMMVALTIFVNKETGLFTLIAFLGALFIEIIIKLASERKSLSETLFLLLSFAVGILSLKLYPFAPNPSSKYFLDGFYSFQVNLMELNIVLFAIFSGWATLIILWRNLSEHKKLKMYIFSMLYAQCFYFYFVWGGGHAHFFTLLPIYILPWVIVGSTVVSFKYQEIVYPFIAVTLFLFYCWGIKEFSIQKINSDKVFQNHITYTWNFERTGGFLSTIDPKPFEEDVKLISKYEDESRIYMISKYDNIFSIFAKKFSALQFFELRSLIVTASEFNAIKEQLSTADLIFVDNDIDRDFNKEMKSIDFWHTNPFMILEHIKQRIPKLLNLKNLFNEVKDNYELVEKGNLISVYKKK